MKINSNNKVIWFTGLSGSGKSTLSNALKTKIESDCHLIKMLDGDDLRKGLNSGLGFTIEDRIENIRRAAEVSKLFLESNFTVICSFITPLNQMRELAKKIVGSDNFIEIFVKCSIETCEKRDVKGLYEKVRKGELMNFTGINSDFEIPVSPSIILDTERLTIDECVDQIVKEVDFNF